MWSYLKLWSLLASGPGFISPQAFLLYQNSSLTPACFGYIWRKWKYKWNSKVWHHLPGKCQLRWLHSADLLPLCSKQQPSLALMSPCMSYWEFWWPSACLMCGLLYKHLHSRMDRLHRSLNHWLIWGLYLYISFYFKLLLLRCSPMKH